MFGAYGCLNAMENRCRTIINLFFFCMMKRIHRNQPRRFVESNLCNAICCNKFIVSPYSVSDDVFLK